MSIRQQINDRPWLGLVAGALLIIFAVVMTVRSQSTGRPRIILNSKAYFSADDGRTIFVDSVTRPTPFRLADGREAVLAHVFSLNGNDHFVAFLERDDGGSLSNVQVSSDPSAPGSLGSRVVKRPGDKVWAPMTSAEGMSIMHVKGSDGDQATQVEPDSE